MVLAVLCVLGSCFSVFVQIREIHSNRIVHILVTLIVSINTFRYSYVRARCSVSTKVNFAFRDLQESFGFYTLQVPRNTNKWVSSFRSVPRLKKNYRREFVPTRPCRRSKKESWYQQSSSKITPSYIIVFSSTEVAVFDFFHSPTNEIETHNSCFRKLPNNPNESNPKIIHHEQAIQGRTSAW